jgi:general secretion pathway protein N
MRRIRLRTGPAALFGAIFIVALVGFLPMRLMLGWIGLGDLGLTARQVRGSVWFGELSDAHAGGLALGDLATHVSPVQLLLGRAHIDVAAKGDRPFRGAIGISRHGIGVDDLSASVPGSGGLPQPIATLDLDDVTAQFKDGACQRAEGRVRAMLAGQIGGVPLPQTLAGSARCDGNALLLPLASTAGTETLDIRLHRDGSYAADLAMRTGDPQLATKLQSAGFRLSSDGYLLSLQGRL